MLGKLDTCSKKLLLTAVVSATVPILLKMAPIAAAINSIGAKIVALGVSYNPNAVRRHQSVTQLRRCHAYLDIYCGMFSKFLPLTLGKISIGKQAWAFLQIFDTNVSSNGRFHPL